MKALWLRMAMCVPMYLFEHHLACDLVFLFFNFFSIVFSIFPKSVRNFLSDLPLVLNNFLQTNREKLLLGKWNISLQFLCHAKCEEFIIIDKNS